jgi:hypothetical protein
MMIATINTLSVPMGTSDAAQTGKSAAPENLEEAEYAITTPTPLSFPDLILI